MRLLHRERHVGGGRHPAARGLASSCYAAVRAAGGLCVADEVQTGLGRGRRYLVGLPATGRRAGHSDDGEADGQWHAARGGGVHAREVSDAFACGPEYFNTFGGNPVFAAGLAVFETIERERLRERRPRLASGCGAPCASSQTKKMRTVRWWATCAAVASSSASSLCASVRRTPATAETNRLCSRLKDEHRIPLPSTGHMTMCLW